MHSRFDRTGESLCYNGIWLEILEKLGIGCFHEKAVGSCGYS